MRLSHLDILLATATIFVVLFGLSNRGGPLPEVEGKALAMWIVIPRNNLVSDLEIELEYLTRGSANHKPLHFDSKKEVEVKANWGTLVVHGRSNPQYLTCRITGQPELASTIKVHARAKLAGKLEDHKQLLLVASAESSYEKQSCVALMEWIQQGVNLAIASDGLPGSQKDRIVAWQGRCPQPGTGKLLATLKSIAGVETGEVDLDGIYAYALLVHDSLVDKDRRLLPPIDPTDLKEGRIRDLKRPLFRAGRHLVTLWGAETKLMRGYPSWGDDVIDSSRYFIALNRENSIQDLTRRRDFPDMGLFALRDYLNYHLKTIRVCKVYAGESECRVMEWRPTHLSLSTTETFVIEK